MFAQRSYHLIILISCTSSYYFTGRAAIVIYERYGGAEMRMHDAALSDSGGLTGRVHPS